MKMTLPSRSVIVIPSERDCTAVRKSRNPSSTRFRLLMSSRTAAKYRTVPLAYCTGASERLTQTGNPSFRMARTSSELVRALPLSICCMLFRTSATSSGWMISVRALGKSSACV
jgi:hypothetical protein